MDKIEKILRILTSKERDAMLLLMEQLRRDYASVPGILPLRGMRGFFRIRLGNYRIIFSVDAKTQNVEIRRVTRRNEKTYKGL